MAARSHTIGTPNQAARVLAVLVSPVIVRLPVLEAHLFGFRQAVLRVSGFEVPAEHPMHHRPARGIRVEHVSSVEVALYSCDEVMMSALMGLVLEHFHPSSPLPHYPILQQTLS